MTALVGVDGDRVETLLTPDRSVRLGVARTNGNAAVRTSSATAWVLVEGGSGELRIGEQAVQVEGRSDVFDRPGWSAVVGRDNELTIEGDVATTVVWRASDRDASSRVIDPGTIAEESRGEGTTARRVRTYVSEGELMVGETLNPPGGWSSWPPHRHEHEEIYLYRFEPAHGFGVHVGYDETDGDQPVIVRDGSIERITKGWHPVVAAPGFTMYYLWALAGDADVVDQQVDPRYA